MLLAENIKHSIEIELNQSFNTKLRAKKNRIGNKVFKMGILVIEIVKEYYLICVSDQFYFWFYKLL